MAKMWENPYQYEGKIIHVGTPGIFHAPHPDSPMSITYCGITMLDARSTDNELLHYQPCLVCFSVRETKVE
jgi:hypothetical protein